MDELTNLVMNKMVVVEEDVELIKLLKRSDDGLPSPTEYEDIPTRIKKRSDCNRNKNLQNRLKRKRKSK